MTRQKKFELISFGSIYALILGFSIFYLITQQYLVLLFIAYPSLFLIPLYLSFSLFQNKETHIGFYMGFTIALRFFIIAIAALVPSILWGVIDFFKEGVSVYYIFIPFIEVVIIYIINIVTNFAMKKD